MTRWLLFRVLWLLATLLGVTFVTFLVLESSPVDRAEIEAMQAQASGSYVDVEQRQAAIEQLRIQYGMLDPVTLEPRPIGARYMAWLRKALTLRFAGPGEDHEVLWRRLAMALPVTTLLGGIALLLAIGLGLPIGAWLGRNAGRKRERALSTVLLVALGIPEFLLATVALLAFSVLWMQWFPAAGLRSFGSENWSVVRQLLDFAHHLVLPVLVIALGPCVMVTRFVRDAVARAAAAPFTASMHALGLDERLVRRRLMRHGATPVATLAGGLLPMLVGGSIVVENLFALDGIGHLAFQAVVDQDQAMVMAIVVLTSMVTLLALLISDLLHRFVDARVRLGN